MTRSRQPDREFPFLTRKQISLVFHVPKSLVDHWIATGQITAMRLSVLGRGGQRKFYNAVDIKKLTLVQKPRKRTGRSNRIQK